VKDYHINIFYSDEDGGYIADIPDLQACSAFGSTPAAALAELEQAKEAWLTVARETGRPVPEPRYRSPRLRRPPQGPRAARKPVRGLARG
jgi:predicted RNase H-like HicB family nuclease